jgi:hypothetical protein
MAAGETLLKKWRLSGDWKGGTTKKGLEQKHYFCQQAIVSIGA